MYWPSFVAGWITLGLYALLNGQGISLNAEQLGAVNGYCSDGGCF